MLPNWIIIGAPKCFTSSLFRWLSDHPQVCGSREKETYYFVDQGTHMFRPDRNFHDHGLHGYEDLFPDCSERPQVVFEATPSYLYSQTALRELPSLTSRPSFIVVLREPVAQLRSLHQYFQENWNWIPRDLGFADFVRIVDSGQAWFKGNELAANALDGARYSTHLRRWQVAAGRERLLILLSDDLIADNRRTMARVARRMSIDPGFYDSYDFPSENMSYEVRSPLLQQLNIAVRGHLPRGQIYRAARSLYRALNTRRPVGKQSDPAVEAMLSQRYLPMLDELEDEFGLDMARWRAIMRSRVRQDVSQFELSTGSVRAAAEAQ